MGHRVTRLAILSILSLAALLLGISATKPAPTPFDGSWERCTKYQGIKICSHAVTTQRGNRVCGVEGSWASGRYYHTRFVGTADKASMRIDKICGRPGSDTDTHCAGQGPRHLDPDEKVGWGTSHKMVHVCKRRLHGGWSRDEVFNCATAVRDAGLPKVHRLTNDDGPDPEERAWLASCTAGRE